MSKSEVRKLKRVVLFVEYDVSVNTDTDDDGSILETEEMGITLKRIFFVNDDGVEINITKRLTDDVKETMLNIRDQKTYEWT